MPRPIAWMIDDDPVVLRAVERHGRHRYADRFRVMRADSGDREQLSLVLARGLGVR